MHNIIRRRIGLFVRIVALGQLALLCACAPVQESAWSGGIAASTGKVSVMGPSGPIGP